MRDARGQASILIGTMTLTFLLFFAFVINTGMLVNAKINLQNAADLAAYAGAAVQGRQLTQISYLNYEMRRQLKKFMFRYYVIGNMAQQTFPQKTGTRLWAVSPNPDPNDKQNHRINMPAVCVIFSSTDNYCQLHMLPALEKPGSASSLDTLTQVFAQQVETLENLRQAGCKGIGQTNLLLLYYWIFNTDPDLSTVVAEMAKSGDQNLVRRLSTLRTLANGLGLIPKEILLRKRIDTLQKYVNAAPKTLTRQSVEAMQAASGDWGPRERSVQAFLSAYHTLGSHTFGDADSIRLEEMLPTGGDGADLLRLNDVHTEFDTYAVDFTVGQCPPGVPGQNGNGCCEQKLMPFPVHEKVGLRPVVGVAKDPTALTYYAVKLTAKAQILFNPFLGSIELSAYAAAQPFGSRIGPSEKELAFAYSAYPTELNVAKPLNVQYSPEVGGNAISLLIGAIPNMPIYDSDGTAAGPTEGWNRAEAIRAFYAAFGPQLGNGGPQPVPQTLTAQDMERGYHVAMAPNPWETGKYNIIGDLGEENGAARDPFIRNFDPATGMTAIWAPLFSDSGQQSSGNPADAIADMIANFKPPATANQGSNQYGIVFSPQSQKALATGIAAYVNDKLAKGQGEDGEGMNVIRLRNPFKTRSEGAPPADIAGIPPTIYLRDPKLVKTSWNQVLAQDYRAAGRTGYSVKYVPLRLLRNGSGVTTDGSNTFSNRLPASGDSGADIDLLQH